MKTQFKLKWKITI